MNKRGQLTMFIIIGILILAIIFVYMLWVQPDVSIERSTRVGFEGCIQDSLDAAIESISGTSGFIDPEFVYLYQDHRLPYLCYTNEFFVPCVVQKPFLQPHFERNLEVISRESFDLCYSESLADLRDQGYEVTQGSVTSNVSLEPGFVRAHMSAPTTVGSTSLASFNVATTSSLYTIVAIATSIVQQETSYGDSDVSSLMFLYPDLLIDKLKQGDGTTVYVIEHKTTGEVIRFASRSVVFPAGYVQVS